LEARIDYIETTGKVLTDTTHEIVKTAHGIRYLRSNGKYMFRPYSRVVSISSSEPIPYLDDDIKE